ncbi:LysR family transcriptional regulator [Clostridium estertheticum]|uniref:LysR family transcriptional regulator n=1 Tax=Clostridium estertheticum TaxID=238834 RepID=UPI001C0CAC4B|nr:LysR family transcriptional regulator [Clostridium estertheticum]MBU3199845.1 LysR family transcriptional regulator [Clostridium estertheticum]WAG67053.1 LysR family transcriptional regulator [Clostridium estertheticum]
MHIKQLECFVNLAETLSFSRTAELLYITQPTVTNQINTLEDELRLKLLIRTKRKVELTPAGISFYNDMKDILTRTNIAIAKARHCSLAFESNISISYDGNAEVKYLPNILSTFKEKFPHIHIYLKISDFKEKRNLFTNYNFDLTFTVKESIQDLSDVDYEELFTGRFVCVLPKDHPLTHKAIIKIDDLQNQSLILLDPLKCPSEMARVQKEIQEKCPTSMVYFGDGPLISYTMIKGNLGIAVMPDFVCTEDPELSIIPMDISDLISYGIAWHKNNVRDEIKGFIAITKQIYKIHKAN